jgi:hydrogenase nickel incorporation protein HypB
MHYVNTHRRLDLFDPARLLEPLRCHRFGHGTEDGTGSPGDHDDVLAAIESEADEVHQRLVHDRDVFAVELLGSTGSGKTELVERLLERHDRAGDRVGVVCGDVAGEDDARRYRAHGVPVVNVTTGKDCHLDPATVDGALDEFDLSELDRLYVENVGNMVCPADFPLGASVRALVVSPTEGDDVVRKHPLLFQTCDAVVVNKVDVADAVGADVERMVSDAREIAPETPVFRTVASADRIGDFAAHLDHRRGDPHTHEHVHDAE